MSSTNLFPPPGSKKNRKRAGRGHGSGLGKTAGRGMGGQTTRAGFKKRAWFEGGQMPLQRRLPKVGFKPLKRTTYQVVNLSSFAKAESGATLTPNEMAEKGWIKDPEGLVKVLGDGEVTVPLHLHAHKFSKSAAEKIQKAGGSVTLLSRNPSAEKGEETAGSEN